MTSKKTKPKQPKSKEVTFQCKFCDTPKPLGEMVVITAYFPPLVACRECEKKIR